MSRPRVVVVGAGVAGLAAAAALLRDAPAADVLVLEARARVGGLVETERTSESFVVEHGADCLVTANFRGIAAVQAAGLGGAIVVGGRPAPDLRRHATIDVRRSPAPGRAGSGLAVRRPASS